MLRGSHTSSGRPESVAEHTWRPCLMALMLRNEFPEVDFSRLIRTCIVHDLGEAITGDVPAIEQDAATPKTVKSVSAGSISSAVAERTPSGIGGVVGDYDSVSSPEARLVKALDKLETIMQHNRGLNPEEFDYRFSPRLQPAIHRRTPSHCRVAGGARPREAPFSREVLKLIPG